MIFSNLQSTFRFSLIWIATWLLMAPQLALATHPYAQWADQFGIDLNASYDGTRVMEMKEGTFEFVEYKAPGKMYTEVNMGGTSSGVLLREDLGKGYLLMPTMGMYKETSLAEGIMQSSNGLVFETIEEVGGDTILGYPSTKYKTRFRDNDGKGAGHIWVTNDGVPIKMDMIYTSEDVKGMRMTMEFVELNMREQDPVVFELDPNLKPMGMMGLGNIFGQGGQQTGGSGAGTSAGLDEVMRQMQSGQLEGLQGMIPGASQQPQAAPAGSGGGASAQSASMSKQLTTDDMTQSVQLHLQYLGIDPGNTSGELSVDTQIAISEFQATKGLKVTGEVTPQLLGILSAEVDSEQ